MPGATRPGASIFLNYSALRERGCVIDQQLLAHLSPLTWEHINLTGDYHWRRDGGLRNRKLRPSGLHEPDSPVKKKFGPPESASTTDIVWSACNVITVRVRKFPFESVTVVR
jgi:hypothetical protein